MRLNLELLKITIKQFPTCNKTVLEKQTLTLEFRDVNNRVNITFYLKNI